MKPLLLILFVVALAGTGSAGQRPAAGRKLTDLNVIPTRVLQRSISPQFYKSLLVSPVEGWIVVRAELVGARLVGAKIIHSELKGLFDPLALQLSKEAVIAGTYNIEQPNLPNSVLLHLLVYKIADGTMVLSFAHLNQPGEDQAQYFGCARLLVLKENKWTEIQGPPGLQGKGWAIRHGIKNEIWDSLMLEGGLATETTNYGRDATGRNGEHY